MQKVTSKDGTIIAFDKLGKGPGVLLVDGALSYREYFGGRPLAVELSNEFTVITYDRRGRGRARIQNLMQLSEKLRILNLLLTRKGAQLMFMVFPRVRY